MIATYNFFLGYVKCLVAATADEQLVDGDGRREAGGFSPADIAPRERETESLGREFKVLEETHGRNVLNLVIVVGYLRRLLENARVHRYLGQQVPEVLAESKKLVEARNIGDPHPGGGTPSD